MTGKWKNWSDLENVKGTNQKNVSEMLPEFAEMLSYFQVYPDKFIDYILDEDSTFKLYPFQRIFLRIMARYQKVYITATRGTSKSFLNILSMYLKCIFFPGIKLSLVAPQKDQASQIAQQNIENIWNFMPLLQKECKKYTFAKDFTRIIFWNNSVLDIVVASQGSRGLRRHGLSFEEICQMEKHREVIGEVLLPLLANNRKGADGKVSKHELHKQLMYVTTASSRQSYAWEQLYSVMIDMARMKEEEGNPDNKKSAFVVGNDYNLPVLFEQLDSDYIESVRNDPSMSPLQFAREYRSEWTGSSENSLVQLKDLEKCRTIANAEFGEKAGKHEYIISVDVARSERKETATTAIAIFKISPKGDGRYTKQLINIHIYKKRMHFQDQANYIKGLVGKFGAKMVVIDGNGLGRGLLDYLVKEDDIYPSYSVVNDDTYDKYKTPNSLPLIFNVMSNTKETNSSNIHNNFMTSIANHDLRLLIPVQRIEEKIKNKKISDMEKAELMEPYLETGYFVDEVMNLIYEARGNKTVVKRVSKGMEKDRYSAVSYGLYYIYLLEKKNQMRKRQIFDAKGFFAVKKARHKIWD
ncbi:DNA-packaging protein [Bacillus velezensis]|uniref:DNA-packaging protein n=1 Tax=Bacillus velezensis TaxID=492670 RepID=UPI0018C7012D|nr:DNA-packaging protein [Bacillus velezensis]QPK89736.1 DNA-packaging protein [Bacillus velezensis]